jgi:hypothetical protein
MKSLTQAILITAMAVASLTLLAGCASRPGNSEIEEAVKASLRDNVPISWVGNLMGGKNARIGTIEIKERGTFNKDGKYWPVKIRVVGSAELNDPFNQGKVSRFDQVAEFRFSKDDYGKWHASLTGGMFQ